MSASGIISTVNASDAESDSCFDRKDIEEERQPLVKKLWIIVAMTITKHLSMVMSIE